MLNLINFHRRFKELQEKNERTKAKIKRRDELRKQRQDKMLEESALHASLIVAHKKRALDYCSAKSNFGLVGEPVRRVNNFKRRPNSQNRPLISARGLSSKNRS